MIKILENLERPSDTGADLYPVQGRHAKEAGVNLAKTMAARGNQIDIKKLYALSSMYMKLTPLRPAAEVRSVSRQFHKPLVLTEELEYE